MILMIRRLQQMNEQAEMPITMKKDSCFYDVVVREVKDVFFLYFS